MEASPINRKEFLKRVQTDAFRRGFVTEETRTLWREVKVSAGAFEAAKRKGDSQREAIRKKHRVWDLYAEQGHLRDKLKRALSCGDCLDEAENQELILKLRVARTVADEAQAAADLEIQNTEVDP